MAGYSVEDQVTALEALAEGRKLRRIVWVNLALWIVFFLLAAIDLGIILLALWSAWQTGDWENLDDNMLGAMFPFVFLFLLPIFPAWHRNALPAVDALRHAAIESRDNALFDSAMPEEPDTTDLLVGSERFDHIGALSNRQVADRLGRLVPISALLLQPSTLLFSLYNGISRESVLPLGTYLPDSKTVDTSMAVLGAVMLLLWIVLFVRARKYRRGVPVTADEWNIQWHPRRHRTVSLAWHDVRSFFMFSYGSTSGSRSAGLKTQVYVLDAGDTLLVWQRYPALSNVSAAVRQRNRGRPVCQTRRRAHGQAATRPVRSCRRASQRFHCGSFRRTTATRYGLRVGRFAGRWHATAEAGEEKVRPQSRPCACAALAAHPPGRWRVRRQSAAPRLSDELLRQPAGEAPCA